MHPRAGHNIHEGKLPATRGKQFSSPDAKLAGKMCRNANCFSDRETVVMKSFTVIAFFAAVLLTPVIAQTPNPKDADELNALIKEVQAQQAEIAENQAKIEEKLAMLGETIRQARIYAGRGGN
jgi:hypothetical protein